MRIIVALGPDGKYTLGPENLARVGKAGVGTVQRDVIVLLADLLWRIAASEQIHHEFDADASALDDGLADKGVTSVDTQHPVLRCPPREGRAARPTAEDSSSVIRSEGSRRSR